MEEKFFRARGLDVVANVTLDVPDVRAWPRIEPARWRELALRVQVDSGADALVLSCTNIRALEIVEALELASGVPVLTSNQAAFWSALVAVGVEDSVPGCGALLAKRAGSCARLQAGAA
jgi:maleate isomerase